MAVFPRVITTQDVRVGDTVHVLTRDADVEILETVRVASIPEPGSLKSVGGVSVDIWDTSVVYLIHRPETSPEVEAIVKALGVTYDQASDYHSKGVRIQ